MILLRALLSFVLRALLSLLMHRSQPRVKTERNIFCMPHSVLCLELEKRAGHVWSIRKLASGCAERQGKSHLVNVDS
jgi:hypothetical protein